MTDDGIAILDSGAIVEYLEKLCPERPMIGTDALSRARIRSLERLGSDRVARGQLWLWNRTGAFPAKERAPSKEIADRTYRDVSELLDVLEVASGESEFLAGDAPTVADFIAFTIFQTASERFELPFGERHPRLDAWYRRFRTKPAGRKRAAGLPRNLAARLARPSHAR